jgi:Mitochondrial ATP synthase B chain precursor (ATP-synt_B)
MSVLLRAVSRVSLARRVSAVRNVSRVSRLPAVARARAGLSTLTSSSRTSMCSTVIPRTVSMLTSHRAAFFSTEADANKPGLKDSEDPEAIDLAALNFRMPAVPKVHPLDAASSQALAAGNTREAYGLHPNAGAVGESGILDRYGLLPLLGFGAVAAISKEMFILNEEVLVAACFFGFSFVSYITIGDSIREGIEAEREEQKAELRAVFDKVIESVEKDAADLKTSVQLQASVDAYCAHVEELYLNLVKARPNIVQNDINAFVNDMLHELLQLERRIVMSLKFDTAARATQHVREQLAKADSKSKQELVDAAISQLEGAKAAKDPIRDLYIEFYKQHEATMAKATSTDAKLSSEEQQSSVEAVRAALERVKARGHAWVDVDSLVSQLKPTTSARYLVQ